MPLSYGVILMALCCTPSLVHSQATNQRNTTRSGLYFHTIMIDADYYVNLNVNTTKSIDTYNLRVEQSGEYGNALLLESSIRNDTLFIKDSRSPLFDFPQDKLSAHKVTDTKLTLEIPKNKALFITAYRGDVAITGDYTHTTVNLANGSLLLENMSGPVRAVTTNASIVVQNMPSYQWENYSRYGVVRTRYTNPQTGYLLQIETIHGNIDIH